MKNLEDTISGLESRTTELGSIHFIGENVIDMIMYDESDFESIKPTKETVPCKGISLPNKITAVIRGADGTYYESEFHEDFLLAVDSKDQFFFPEDREVFKDIRSEGKYALKKPLEKRIIDKPIPTRGFIVNCTEETGGGGAYNSARTALTFLSEVGIPLEVTFVSNVYSPIILEELGEILHRTKSIQYESLCTNSEINRNFIFYISGQKYTFTSPSQPPSDSCDYTPKFNRGDTIQINSLKNVTLFERLFDYFRENKGSMDLKVIAAVTESMGSSIRKSKDKEEARKMISEFTHEYCDVLVINETESAILAEMNPKDVVVSKPQNLYDCLKKIKPNGGRAYLTFGSDGIYVMDEKGDLYHQEAIKTECKRGNTSGCGDAASGIITLLESVSDMTIPNILDAANAAGCLHYMAQNVTLQNMIRLRKDNIGGVRKYNSDKKEFELFVKKVNLQYLHNLN